MTHSSTKLPTNILLISYNFPGVKTDGMGVGKIRPGHLSKFLAQNAQTLFVVCGPRDYHSEDKMPIELASINYVDAFIPPRFWRKHDPENINLSRQKGITSTAALKFLESHHFLKYKQPAKYVIKHFYPSSDVRFPDKTIFWQNKAYRVAKILVQERNISLVLSCSGPPSTAIIASKLRKNFAVKWIADFRDLWSLNHSDHRTWIFNFFERLYEKKTLSKADHLVTISTELNRQMTELHHKKVFTIESGFDEDEFAPKAELDKEIFRILYTGQVYPEYNPSPLFEAIASILKTHTQYRDKIRIDFYGNATVNRIQRFINDHQVKKIVSCHDSKPRNDIIRLQKQATLLFLLIWKDEFSKGVLTAKVFEYLAARRPILALGFKHGDLDNILNETESGIMSNDSHEIKVLLLKWLDMFFNKRDYTLGFNLTKEKASKYSSRNMGEKFLRLVS